MSNQIKIYNLIVNGIAQNANVDIGRTVQNSHTANVKLYGANFSMGDFSPTHSVIVTKVKDPDYSDQGQTENPSSADNSQ
ncbi:spore germination protein [Niallia sp. XMNu-256]|uniref:spore germination protein n=1 Tax=Niallia sp. XMNu-256 TaxID=3082444 RepID=UPI0030D0431B